MKKLFVFFLTFLFLLSQIGLAVTEHICGSHTVKLSFYETPDESDCCGATEAESNCCHNEFKQVKNDEVFLAAATSHINAAPLVSLIDRAELPQEVSLNNLDLSNFYSGTAPPVAALTSSIQFTTCYRC